MEQTTDKRYQCPLCCGDGKETCDNPDHGFISVMSFHDIGRIGCPCCGHDPNHKVPNGGDCELCDGTGAATIERINEYGNFFEDDLIEMNPEIIGSIHADKEEVK